MRTERWQRDPQRCPNALPDTFQLQLWFLPYPNLCSSSEEMQSLTAFANEMRVMLERLTSGGKRYHVRWPLVKRSARKCPKATWTALAIRLGLLEGSDQRDPMLAQCLCVDLADELLSGVDDLLESEVPDVKLMLQTWQQCYEEDVRSKGSQRLAGINDKTPVQSLPGSEDDDEESHWADSDSEY